MVKSLRGFAAVATLLLSTPTWGNPTELTSPPELVGPVCHFLDRGLDDHVPGTTDRYAVTPHGPRTLADIRHLSFGIDVAESHCEWQSHAVPCADHDDPQQWCIQGVGLSVLGFDLFHLEEAEGCLLRPRPGLDGMRTLSSSTLRNHPQWGLSADQLGTLISGYDPVSGGFRLPSIRFSADFLARQIEGLVGEQLARYVKGCANKLYCGNRRGRLLKSDLLPFWTRPDDVDCDLGGCPAIGQRRSSPWVEIEGRGDRLHVDLDIEVDRGAADLGDKAKLGTEVLPYYGTTYKQILRGSVGIDLGFECQRFAKVEGGKLPHCAEVEDKVCFNPGPQVGSTDGTVVCPEGKQHPLCGQSIDYERSHELRVTVDEPVFESESGDLIDALIEVGCVLFGQKGQFGTCDVDELGTFFIQQELETSVLDVLIQDGLGGCPDISIEPEGAVTLDFKTEGGLVLESAGTQSAGASSPGSLSEFAPIVTRGSRDRGLGQPGLISTAALTSLAAGLGADRHHGGSPAEGSLADSNTDAKIPMAQLDAALRLICALSTSCPGIDLGALPIDQLADLGDGGSGDDLLDLPPAELLAVLAPLLADEGFRQCVGGDTDPLQLFEILTWLMSQFQPAFDSDTCTALRVEALLPLVGLELRVKTAGPEVGDTFAFVDFGYSSPGLMKQHGCMAKWVYPTSDAPICDNGTIAKGPDPDHEGRACGTAPGGPCHDIRGAHPEWTRSLPEDSAFHPNGDFRWFTRCGHDFDSGEPMVCVAEYYN
ncbi:MAG: hypothetical protein AAGM22_25855, partial [Acidobacteriota bacterium]